MHHAAQLAQRAAAWVGNVFATIDGAHFKDVRSVLRDHGLGAESLFLELPGRPSPVSGPFFTALDHAGLMRLAEIPGIEQACVLWCSPVSTVLAYRHFRKLNHVKIPSVEFQGTHERVLFRHWDPAVLALMLPLLEPEQRPQLFGPMTRAAFYSADAGQVLEATARHDWPPAPRGPLEFSQAQMEQTAEAMKARSHRAVARFLRRNAEPHTAAMDDAALLRFVDAADAESRQWGVRYEAGIGRFAWLLLVTEGRLRQMPEARTFILGDGSASDDRLRQLMQAMALKLRQEAQA